MSKPPRVIPEEARRRVLDLIDTLMAGATDGRLRRNMLATPEFTRVLAELRTLDPALQRRIARAMVESRGDPAALRAALVDVPAADAARAVHPRPSPRPPTVVDARGDTPWRVIGVALLAVALVAVLIAGGQ